ncbi:helix-turn-helix transcriptional regulator [Halobacterium litoreum]|uniref:Helix-turn-helix transcriptional regulator n=1 Tax=Halobacterium litoreum TaxID=2039234 RepID=A0ABD5NGM2_9EURY|nr:hypothetical protein [Halobacterium litoreum]UHH12963.1 hypothetical protein LT972_12465 [Halobacterium litoreum]
MSASSGVLQVVHKRLDILRYVCDQHPSKRKLADAASKSRATVDRAVRELEEHDLVYRTDGQCKPTLAGAKACELYVDVEESFAVLDDVTPELSALSPDADLPSTLFRDGSVFQPPARAPYERIEPLYEDLSRADSLVAVTRVFLSPYVDQTMSRGASGEMDLELLVDEEMIDAMPDAQHSVLRECIDSGATVYAVDEPPDYTLFLVDGERLYVALYADSNHLSAVIQNTGTRAVEWAADRLSRLQRRATQLSAASV